MCFRKLVSSHREFPLLLIILFAFVTRIWRLNHPQVLYFDEVYHVPAAKLIAANDPRAYEWWHEPIFGDSRHDWLHPPLAKLIQAGSMQLLGDSAWGWRLPSVMAGAISSVVIYFFARKLFLKLDGELVANNTAILAAFLFTLDGLSLVQSRIAMNDIFLVMWLLLALLSIAYWQPTLWAIQLKLKNANHWLLILAGVMLGLALATKWSAIFLIGFLLLLIGAGLIKAKAWQAVPLVIFSLVLLPAIVYLTSYSQLFLQGKNLQYLGELHQQIIWYQTHRDTDHAYASKPWQWLTNSRPVWYWTDEQLTRSQPNSHKTANIYALGNPILHLVAIGAIGCYFVSLFHLKSTKFNPRTWLRASLLGLYLFLFVPWLLSPRIMFYFHYLPATTILVVMVSEFLTRSVLRYNKSLFWLVLALIIICFVLYYPLWTGVTLSQFFLENYNYLLTLWC